MTVCGVGAKASLVTIGRLAQKAGVTSQTLRLYERLGLIRPTRRTAAGYRLYGEEAARRLAFIRRAQTLGFSLEETGELLALHDRADAGAAEVKALTEARIRDIEARMRDLERIRDGLATLSARCDGKGSGRDCPILAALATPEQR